MMAAPLGVLMLLMMKSMFKNARINTLLHAAFGVVFILAYFGVRSQALVGDDQFLRSMIPHHSGAILLRGALSQRVPLRSSKSLNPGAGEFQDLMIDGKPIYQIVAENVANNWNENGNVGSGTGVLKLNANLFNPKINSLVTVDVGDQR